MAASTLGLASPVCGASAPATNSSMLSSRSAFGTSVVQFSPVSRSVGTANRVVVVKANLFEDHPATGKKVLASFLAAGAALSIAGQALAGNPIDLAKNKADEVVSSTQNATSGLPDLPKIEFPNAGNAAEGAIKDIQGRIDGIFGKDKPLAKGRVASTNGGTGSAIGDAKKRVANFPGKNPFAENLANTTEEFNASIPRATGENSGSARSAREFLGQDSTRVDTATERVKELGDNFKNKAGNALDEAKSFVGSAQNATPDLPSLPTPELPSLPNPLEGVNNMGSLKAPSAPKVFGDLGKKVQGTAADAKDSVASTADNVKGDVSSKASSFANRTPGDAVDNAKNVAQNATSNFPSVPNPFEGLSKNMKGTAAEAKDSVASTVDNVKGDVSSKASSIANRIPGDAVDSAKNVAQNATSSVPSVPNPFEGLSKNVKGTAADAKDSVASTVDNVKGDLSSKTSNIANSTSGDAAESAKNVAQNATSGFPNPFEGLSKNMKKNGADVKDTVASKVDDVKDDVSSKTSSLGNSVPSNVADGGNDLLGSVQDAASNLPSLPNPLEGLKNLPGSGSKVGNLEDGLKAKASLK